MSLAQKHPRSPSPVVSGSPAKRLKLSDDSTTMDARSSAPDAIAFPVVKDVPGVDQLGADMPNGGGVVKANDHVGSVEKSNGHAENNVEHVTVDAQAPSDDEEEEEQPEAVAEEGIDRKDMYLDAVSDNFRRTLYRSSNIRLRSHGRIWTLISSVYARNPLATSTFIAVWYAGNIFKGEDGAAMPIVML